MIITVAHQKGGTGKSTIATNLAVELKTSLLDLDKQHSSIIFNQHFTTFTLPRKLTKLVYTRPALSPLDFLRIGL